MADWKRQSFFNFYPVKSKTAKGLKLCHDQLISWSAHGLFLYLELSDLEGFIATQQATSRTLGGKFVYKKKHLDCNKKTKKEKHSITEPAQSQKGAFDMTDDDAWAQGKINDIMCVQDIDSTLNFQSWSWRVLTMHTINMTRPRVSGGIRLCLQVKIKLNSRWLPFS